jgi:hypothetical protein
MKSKTTLILCAALLSAAIAATAMTASTLAQTRTEGVQEGEWYKYGNITVNWESENPEATPPDYLVEMNETEWWNMTITDITDTNVTIDWVAHLTNGTDITGTDYIDIETGNSTESMFMIISQGLEEGDSIYEGEYTEWLINETIPRTYPDGDRYTNHINITEDEDNAMNLYWDNQTGVMVEWTESSYIGGDFPTSWNMTFIIIDSSVWVVPEFNAPATILAAFTATTAATVIGKRKLGKKQAL